MSRQDRIIFIVLLIILAGIFITGCSSEAAIETGNPIVATAAEVQSDSTPAEVETDVPQEESSEESTEEQIEQADMPQAADIAGLEIELKTIVFGLDTPLGMTHAGDGSERLFVLEKEGRIKIVEDNILNDDPFLDIRYKVAAEAYEQGLLGLAFHPDYANNGLFFVHYTSLDGNTVISRFSASDDPDKADTESEELVLILEQPAANHNGGHLAFGPDGYLYIGMGDGGASGDRYGNGQNGQTLLGAMLRLDVDALPYSIPPDNPFVDNPDIQDEIWAIGLRNPWRYSFDSATGDLYIADVGQNIYEEIHIQLANSSGGENYGWPIVEGFHCYEAENCTTAGLTMPVAEYAHDGKHCSITGGYVYRGEQYPAMQGVYIFADFCSGTVWGLAENNSDTWQVKELMQITGLLSSFGEGEDGELYLLDMASGVIYHIEAG